jgi:hypothetical protein
MPVSFDNLRSDLRRTARHTLSWFTIAAPIRNNVDATILQEIRKEYLLQDKDARRRPKALADSRLTDPVDRLHLAVRFANAKLDVSAQQTADLDRQVGGFCGARFDVLAPGDSRQLQHLRRNLSRLQRDARWMFAEFLRSRLRVERARVAPFNAFTDGAISTYVYPSGMTVEFVDGVRRPSLLIRVSLEMWAGCCHLSGSARDKFLLELQRLLDSPVSARLRACPYCGSVFVRTGRKEYCTEQCRNQGYWKEYKKREDFEAKRVRQCASQGWARGVRRKPTVPIAERNQLVEAGEPGLDRTESPPIKSRIKRSK